MLDVFWCNMLFITTIQCVCVWQIAFPEYDYTSEHTHTQSHMYIPCIPHALDIIRLKLLQSKRWGLYALILPLGRDLGFFQSIGYGGSDAMWLSRLGHKRVEPPPGMHSLSLYSLSLSLSSSPTPIPCSPYSTLISLLTSLNLQESHIKTLWPCHKIKLHNYMP